MEDNNQPLDITTQLVKEEDPDKIKSIINLFNLNVAKKNAVRIDTLNELIDDVLSKVGERLQLRPDEFSNKDLIDYLNALYTAAEKSGKIVSGAEEIPAITINQQNNVIVNDATTLSRESRQRIAEVVAVMLNQTQQIEGDIIDGSEDEEPVEEGNGDEQ